MNNPKDNNTANASQTHKFKVFYESKNESDELDTYVLLADGWNELQDIESDLQSHGVRYQIFEIVQEYIPEKLRFIRRGE